MNSLTLQQQRVVSGMRPTGRLHLGHYHGVLKNWLKLQHQHDCFFFVADWHALTTHYEETDIIADSVLEMVIDWLSVGIDPQSTCLFLQSRVPEHAELYVLLSMITPLAWLERIPSYKDQMAKASHARLATHGFLGYPLLQSADILLYRAEWVPIGEDQLAHVELTREIARHFNYLFGRDADFLQKAEEAIKKLGKKNAKLYKTLRTRYVEQGNQDALAEGRALITEESLLTLTERERLHGHLEGGGKTILVTPQPLLEKTAKLPGLDGQKMSKSYHNTITLRESSESVTLKINKMPTDPARVRRIDPGTPEKCPVWSLHLVYTDEETRKDLYQGCRTAGIGCLDCKCPLIDAILKEQAPFREQAEVYIQNPSLLKTIILDGCETAREEAKKSLKEIRQAMGLDYS